MTVHNIRIKKRDGSEWITLHPETMAKNVIVENGKTVQYELDNHTHRYAGSSSVGGAANSAIKLTTARTINGVAFDGTANINIVDSSKVAPTGTIVANRVAIFNDTTGKIIKDSGFTIASSVPANAKFTDTNTWRAVQDNLTSTAVDQSLSANQGRILKGLIDGKAASSHTHSYLPLSGGTITMADYYGVVIKRNHATNGSSIAFSNTTGQLGGIGFQTGMFVVSSKTGTAGDLMTINDTTVTLGSKTVTASRFSGALSGNATTATTLQTARTINGTSFNGSANITTANWGTARTLTVGNSSKSVNGSANISWTLAEIGASPTSHLHDDRYFRKVQDIGTNVNLNTLTTTGRYHQSSNSNATTALNYPTAKAGLLKVYNDGYIYQEYHAYDNSGAYRRTCYNGTWYAWTSLQGSSGSVGPQGPQGPAGVTPTIKAGTVTTGAAGTSAAVTATTSGTTTTFNFTIPTGATGATGPQGPAGPNTVTTTTTTSGFTNGHILYNNNGKVGAKAITAASIGALPTTGGTVTGTINATNLQVGGANVYTTSRKPTLKELNAYGFQGLLGNAVNLNSYTSTGFYTQGSNAQAASGTNYPRPYAGVLEVHASTDGAMIWQKYHVYGWENTIWVRTYYAGEWSRWRESVYAYDLGYQESYWKPTYQNGWRSYGSPYDVRVTKDDMRMVHLEGLITGGTMGKTMFNLPVGYRPKQGFQQAVANNFNGYGQIVIYPGGDVVAYCGSSGWMSLDGITYVADV
jgi:hypothetical protein